MRPVLVRPLDPAQERECAAIVGGESQIAHFAVDKFERCGGTTASSGSEPGSEPEPEPEPEPEKASPRTRPTTKSTPPRLTNCRPCPADPSGQSLERSGLAEQPLTPRGSTAAVTLELARGVTPQMWHPERRIELYQAICGKVLERLA